MHRFAADELAQRRTEHRPPVTAPRVGGATRALELELVECAVRAALRTEDDGAPVAELPAADLPAAEPEPVAVAQEPPAEPPAVAEQATQLGLF